LQEAHARSREETLDQSSACWEGLDEPGSGKADLHDFQGLLMIPFCMVLCGGGGAVDLAQFAEVREPFLRAFLNWDNSVPNHDKERKNPGVWLCHFRGTSDELPKWRKVINLEGCFGM
jgi:hypothetical protein